MHSASYMKALEKRMGHKMLEWKIEILMPENIHPCAEQSQNRSQFWKLHTYNFKTLL